MNGGRQYDPTDDVVRCDASLPTMGKLAKLMRFRYDEQITKQAVGQAAAAIACSDPAHEKQNDDHKAVPATNL